MPCPHNEISIVQRSHRQSAVAAVLTRAARSCSVNMTRK